MLTHAVIDALLGAAGLGDIGEHFPDTDERWRGADSLRLLEHVAAMLAERGLVVNVDCTVIMEAPKVSPHREAIRARLAAALGVAEGQVNVKASTAERMGFVAGARARQRLRSRVSRRPAARSPTAGAGRNGEPSALLARRWS